MLKALADTGKTFLHTDGSSIVGTRARGELVGTIFDEGRRLRRRRSERRV